MQTTSAARRLLARAILTLAAVFGLQGQAHAVDGCQVLLCLAGNWKNITVCVPPVRAAMRQAALGHGWPSCSMSSGASGGVSEVHVSTNEETCPPFSAEYMTSEYGTHYVGCQYTGVVTTTVNGQLWSTMYWNAAGDAITSYSDAAKSQLGAGNYDTEYDTLLASWEASHPHGPPDECVRSSYGGGCVER